MYTYRPLLVSHIISSSCIFLPETKTHLWIFLLNWHKLLFFLLNYTWYTFKYELPIVMFKIDTCVFNYTYNHQLISRKNSSNPMWFFQIISEIFSVFKSKPRIVKNNLVVSSLLKFKTWYFVTQYHLLEVIDWTTLLSSSQNLKTIFD